MGKISRKVTATILSMSLLTVMAGAAIAPALGIIKQHFSSQPAILIQLIVSIPALMIIITNFFFSSISRRLTSRTIATTGLILYIAAGAGCFWCHNITSLLAMRALLGVSVGLIMPLSTGLLSFYFPPERQAGLMGLSAAMNQLGGVIATLLAGMLAEVQWNYSFLVYLLGIIALLMVLAWLPEARLGSGENKFNARYLVRFHPSVTGMLLLMMIFFIYPTNFAITAPEQCHMSTTTATIVMVGLDVVAFLVGLRFGHLMEAFRRAIKYFAPLLFIAGYSTLTIGSSTIAAITGSALIGIATGIGVPYLNTIASIKGGHDSVTTVMPLLSAALYLGQFISPLLVTPIAKTAFATTDAVAPYKVAIIVSAIYLLQVWCTRHFQSLPPVKRNRAQ